MLIFYYQPFMFVMNCIFMISKKMNKIHGRVTQEQQK